MEPEPNNLYADTIAPVHRTMPGEVFFISMEACPEPDSEDFGIEGGAYVNCYVDADDLRTAEIRAVTHIHEHGWRPQRFDTWHLTCAECADDTQPEHGGDSPRELIQQALLDGSVCIFHTWPIDAPDATDRKA